MKKVLIFGVAGFVGEYLVKEFAQTGGYEVYGSDIPDRYENTFLKAYISCDIMAEENVKTIIQNVQPDYIINLAALSSVAMSWNMPKKTVEVNVIGSLNIMEAAVLLNKIPAVLLIGSSEEYAVSSEKLSETSPLAANNPYGISKMALEQFAALYRKKYSCNIYFTRSFNHTGVGQKDIFVIPSFCRQIAMIENTGKAGEISVGNLTAYRDLSDVRDVVRAYRMILESNSKEMVFNVGSGQAVKMQDVLEQIIRLCKFPVTVTVDSKRLRPSDNPYICCDNTLLTAETGWKPQYTLADTIQEIYQSFLHQEE